MTGRQETPSANQALLGGRYAIFEQLGQGGMGSVFRAVDRLSGTEVALKRVAAAEQNVSTSGDDSRFDPRLVLAQEFQALASLRHPHIIGVLDYGFDEFREPYFTMELVLGARTILQAGRAQPQAVQIQLLVQILQALNYLHRRGIVHRDLKPGNVLVARDSRGSDLIDGRFESPGLVKVLDFGLSVQMGRATGTVGTLAYMAPEVLQGRSIGPPADLYAVGVLAYQLFTGKHPFEDVQTANFIERVLHQPVSLDDLESLDPFISHILLRLLAKDSLNRYPAAADVIRAFRRIQGEQIAVETKETRESFLQAARFVGRDQELGQLLTALGQALSGQGSAWLVAGESGVGKSRLLDEVRIRALVRGALVLRGQAISGAGSPYTLWQSVVRRLVLSTPITDLQAGVLKSLVPDIERLLNRPVPDPAELDLQGAQTRLLLTISELVNSQDRPLIILIEDLQWAGNESLDVLSWLIRSISERPLMVVGDYRDDERPDLQKLIADAHGIKLSRLDDQAIAELSESMLGEAGRQPQVLELLTRDTEGNPFFLVEVVRALAEEAGELEKVGTQDLPDHVFTGGLQRLIQRRLNQVPDAERRVLRLAAVGGRALDLPVLRAAYPDLNIDDWLTVCSNAAVLNLRDDRWQFSHDKLRLGLLDHLPEKALQELHQQIALAMEAAYVDAPYRAARLAYHWARAGNSTKEKHYAAAAGVHALTSGATDEAVEFLGRAVHLEESGRPDGWMRSAVDRLRLARWRRQLGEAHLAKAQLAECRTCLQKSLLALGWPVPISRLGLGPALLGQLVSQVAHRLRPERFMGRATREQAVFMLEATRAYQQLAEIYYFANNKPLILLCGLRALNLSERAGPSPELSRAYANLCIISGLLRRDRWAEAYSNLALETATVVNDVPALAWVLLLSGTYQIGLGRWSVVQGLADRSIALCQETGDKRVLGLAIALRSLVPYHQGAFADALSWCKQWQETGSEIDNTQHQAAGLMGQAENAMRLGRLDEAVDMLDQVLILWTERGEYEEIDVLGRFRWYAVLAAVRMRQAQYRSAREAATAARALLPHVASPNRVTMLDAVADLAEAYLGLWEAQGPDNDTRRGTEIGRRLLRSYARVFPIIGPRAALIEGWYARLNQRPRAARRNWERSLQLADELSMPYEVARAHLELGLYTAGPEKERYLARAHQMFVELEAQGDLARLQAAIEATSL
jgi:eukaryotic-like serine/threonine-protein kinase